MAWRPSGWSRRRTTIVVAAAVAVVIALAGAGAALYLAVRTPSSGGLVAPTGVSVDTFDTVPVTHPTLKKPAKPPVRRTPPDTPCWRFFGGSTLRSLSRPAQLGIPRRSVWARGMGDLMEYPPTYCNDRLFVNLERGKTVALDATTGAVLWKRPSAGPTASSPALTKRNVIVSSHGGTVTALRQKTGALVWQLHAGVPVESSPVVVRNTVYVGASDGRLFALNATTGKPRWVYDVRARISSSPSVVGGLVCITTYHTGVILCLRRLTGARAWTRYFKRDAFRFDSFYSSPSSDGRRIFAASLGGQVVALSARTGHTLWSYHTGGWTYGTPSVANGRVFVADLSRNLWAFRSTNGRVLWHKDVGGKVAGPTLVVGNLLFYSTTDGHTTAVRVQDGHAVWHFRAGEYAPGIATNNHYYFSLNGLLAAFVGTRSKR
jgi:eukaryotic-like serine/threonine-protein kinase